MLYAFRARSAQLLLDFAFFTLFAIEIEKCEKCGGPVRIMHLEKILMLFPMRRTVLILKHLGLDQPSDPLIRSPPPGQTDQQTTLV